MIPSKFISPCLASVLQICHPCFHVCLFVLLAVSVSLCSVCKGGNICLWCSSLWRVKVVPLVSLTFLSCYFFTYPAVLIYLKYSLRWFNRCLTFLSPLFTKGDLVSCLLLCLLYVPVSQGFPSAFQHFPSAFSLPGLLLVPRVRSPSGGPVH